MQDGWPQLPKPQMTASQVYQETARETALHPGHCQGLCPLDSQPPNSQRKRLLQAAPLIWGGDGYVLG